MKLKIYKTVKTVIPRKKLTYLFENVFSGYRAKGFLGSVNLIFISDSRMRRLNSTFRAKDKTTDVLSFNLEGPKRPEAVFGEVYISAAMAASQAKAGGWSLHEEYLRLACHGFLHLLGHDHKKRFEASRMRSLENRYLSGL